MYIMRNRKSWNWFEAWEVEGLDVQLVARLDRARGYAGVPFSLSSGFRAGDPKAHGKRLAVDIRAAGAWQRYQIVRGLIKAGVPRIGVYDRHVHADVDKSLPPGMWSGRSK